MKLLRQVWKKKSRTRHPAVFLDRDGTVIRFRRLVSRKRDVRPYVGATRALKTLEQAGFLLIVFSNKPDIEKKENTLEEVKEMNTHMRQLFADVGVFIDAIYCCPHRHGSDCTCRKPSLGLLHAAQKDFKIDMDLSWLIGDTTRDMEMGRRAKLRTIRVATGDHGPDNQFFKTKGEFAARDMHAAVRIIEKTT